MKYIKTLLIALLLLPNVSFAAYDIGWSATSTTQGWIWPNLINGVVQKVAAFNFISSYFTATSSTATSTFAGAVGVATSTPYEKFEVVGNVIVSPGSVAPIYIGQNQTSPTYNMISFNGGKTDTTYQGFGGGGSTAFYMRSIGDLVFRAGAGASDTRMTILSTGNVGIGTTTPYTNLAVEGTSGITVKYSGVNTPGFLYTNSGGSVALSSNVSPANVVQDSSKYQWATVMSQASDSFAVYRSPAGATWSPVAMLYVDNIGDVGIGTTSPYAKLSVVGEVVGANFTATTSTKSTFPYASSTALTVSGGLYNTSLADGCLNVTSGLIGSTGSACGAGGGGVSGGTAGMLASWTNSTTLTATGTPTAASYIATSTQATSTFAGNLMIGNSLFNGQLDISSLGTGVAQLQVSTSTNDFAKTVFANTSSGASAMFCNIYNNGRSTRAGVSSSYYAGICAAGHNYATPGFDGIKPNGIALFASDGDVSIGSASTNSASSSIRMFVGSGFSSSAQDAILEGGTARFGLSTSSPWGKLSVATANLTTARPLFVIASSSAAIATTTHFIVGSNGNVAIGTTNTTGQLTISGTSVDPNQGFYNNRYGGASAPAFITQQARGTEASPSATQTSDGLFFFGSRGYGDSQFSAASVGAIGMAAASNFTNTSNPTYIYFSTTPVGSVSRAERLRIDSNGYVGIGTTGPTQRLEVEGGIRYNTATAKPTCDSAVRGTTWYVRSGAGVKDTFEVCAKDAADTYAWRTIY